MHSTLTPEQVEYIPQNYFTPQSLSALFPGREKAPLQIDLGSGDGAFLLKMAASHPEENFIGVERLLGRIRKTCRKVARAGLCNVRLMRIESLYFLQYLLPPATANVIHVMFPDPWPKKRHHNRRLVQTGFLNAVHVALQAGGELRLTTDDLPYFEHMREVFTPHPGFREEPWTPGPDYPQTDFERFFRGQGQPIYRACLRRVDLAAGVGLPPVPEMVMRKQGEECIEASDDAAEA